MAGETYITIIGNLVADPELRFTSAGAAVVNYTVASTARRFNKDSSEWQDKEATFMRCTTWRQSAEHVAESLTKGARVIVFGELTQRSYETTEGEKRTVYELQNCEVGPSLQFATAKVSRVARGSAQAGPATGDVPPADDPWASNPPPAEAQGSFTDEAPF